MTPEELQAAQEQAQAVISGDDVSVGATSLIALQVRLLAEIAAQLQQLNKALAGPLTFTH